MKRSIVLACVLLPLQGPDCFLTDGEAPVDLGSSVLSLAGDSVTFLSANNTRVLAHHGSDVTLQCQVDKPPNSAMKCMKVTWTRRRDTGERDLQLLSVGDYTYINDNRFIINNKKVDNSWELTISRVSLEDGGEYLCQASTHPPLTILTHLDVVDAYSEIQVENEAENGRDKKLAVLDEKDVNQKEIFIKKGSKLKLKCVLKKATEKPEFIFWYHNNTMINYSPHTGKIVSLAKSGLQSVLTIKSVGSSDGGVYTCCPHNIIPDTVTINIMDSDGNFAAVSKTSVSRSPVISDANSLVFFSLLSAITVLN